MTEYSTEFIKEIERIERILENDMKIKYMDNRIGSYTPCSKEILRSLTDEQLYCIMKRRGMRVEGDLINK